MQQAATTDLAARAAQLRAGSPGLRARDLAEALGVSEGALVACRCGDGVVRLRPDWKELFEALPALGEVMAITRNDAAVHEKTGCYGNITISGRMGLVLNEAIDLRLFLSSWRHLFLVEEEVRSGRRRSLQLFDGRGRALHKIYELIDADPGPLDALVDRFRNDDQTPWIIEDAAEETAAADDEPVDAAAFQAAWDALKDTHEFFGLLRRFKLARTRAMAIAGTGRAARVQPAALDRVLADAAATALPIMVFVGNGGVLQIHTGPVQRIVEAGPWINVLDPGFNLHLRRDLIDQAWVVRKPTTDGVVTSLELYDARGGLIATLFGKRKPGTPEDPSWRQVAELLPRHEAAA